MKKRLFAMLLAGTMMAGMLTGCGGGATNGGSADGATDSGAASGGDKKITMIMALRDEWLSEMEAGAKNNCPSGVSFETQDAQNDAAKQLQQIEAAKNAGASAIIINLVDPETAGEMKEAAGDLPVVFVNRYPSDPSVLDENCIYVGSDEHTSGKFQGEWLAEYFKGKGQNDIKYILLNGTLGQTSTTLRTESVLKALKDAGINAAEATAPLACDFDRAKAMDKFTPLIGSTEYDCIISNNDAMALGVVEALEQKGIDPAEKPIVGIDASKDGRQGVKDGKLAMSVFQDPVGQGKGAILAAANLINGKDISEGTGYEKDDTGFVLWVPFEPVTAENVADYD
ncbi:substrate-binding domain-containing protein [Butyricicoccus sp. Marseille-Q5471]|uniref:substrate-binding domain-containing protein n=1 Tax=Butyricicoccus sp. Marseille-Q5471 TaxID=3039493 RepID=UPI0024BC36DB|nr:substrate-binding domain-containing protein [Butyricicoccus sp. Marseille-Q5471]